MREDYRLLTPENVELRFDVAGIGSRLGAALIDYVLIGIAYIVLFVGSAFAGSLIANLRPRGNETTSSTWEVAIGFALIAFGLFLGFAAWWGYFLLFELIWEARVPEATARPSVVRRDGQPIDFTTALVRNILRWIDQALMLGVFVMVIDDSSRRLGDMAANTLVVRDPRALRTTALQAVELPSVPESTVQCCRTRAA